MKRTLARLALLAAAAAAPLALPQSADAQMQVHRSQMAPAAGERAGELAKVSADLRALFDAQRQFHAAHGRFAASLDEFPGMALTSGWMRLNAGRDWYVVLGGNLDVGIVQEVVTVTPQQARSEGDPAAGENAVREDR